MQLYTALILLLISASAHAEIHKWTDANGNVHYSQTPPKGTKTKIIAEQPKPAVEPEPEAAAESLNDRLEADKIEQLKQSIADQNAANLKKKQDTYRKNCKISKKSLNMYVSSGRLRIKEKDGSYTRLTEEQRQQRIEDMEKRITTYCATPVTLSESETARIVVTENAPATSDEDTEQKTEAE